MKIAPAKGDEQVFTACFNYNNEKYVIEFSSWNEAFQYIIFFANLCKIQIVPIVTKRYYKKVLIKGKGSLTFVDTETKFQIKFMYKKI